MSHWFHRNPIKASNNVDFEKRSFPSSADAREICMRLKNTRCQLLEFFTDPSKDTADIQSSLDVYLSLLKGFINEIGDGSMQDSKLRHSVTFKWSQSLGNQFIQEEQDFAFEYVNMLFNAALWYTKRAAYVSAVVSEPTDKEAKEVHTCLRTALGMFTFIKDSGIKSSAISQSKPQGFYDLEDRILTAYLNQCKAEAQEITIARAIEMKHSPSLIASIAFDTANLFQAACEPLKDLDKAFVDKWSKYLELKSKFYKAQNYCYYGLDVLAQDKCGDAIKCLQESKKYYQESEELCKEYAKTKGPGTQAIPERHAFFINLGKTVDRYHEKCERENSLIYHQKVAPEAPLYDAKAVHGLANPIDFIDPATHQLWTKQTYASFDISRAVTDKQKKDKTNVEQQKEVPIPQGNADPKTNSGCIIS